MPRPPLNDYAEQEFLRQRSALIDTACSWACAIVLALIMAAALFGCPRSSKPPQQNLPGGGIERPHVIEDQTTLETLSHYRK